MKDYAKRAAFWGSRQDGGFGVGCSEAAPYSAHERLFVDQDVLEIGPGSGRQYEVLSKLAASYSIADISKEVLDKPVFQAAPTFLIKGYDGYLQWKFDIVTFWYVLHHVRHEELAEFAKFVARHVEHSGFAYFNAPDHDSPDSEYRSDELTGDGIDTTPHKQSDVRAAFTDAGLTLIDTTKLAYNSLSMLWSKR